METVGQQRDRQRELRTLEQIAAALALPELRGALRSIRFAVPVTDPPDEADAKAIAGLQDAICRAEGILGVPRAAQTERRD